LQLVATPDNLALTTANGTETASGAANLSIAYTAPTGATSATAAATQVTLTRALASRHQTLSLQGWTETDVRQPGATTSDAGTVTGRLAVASDTLGLDLALGTTSPLTATASGTLSGGIVRAESPTDAMTATFTGGDAISLGIDAGKTGIATSTQATSIPDVLALVE
jgi:hypothetical protein